jgi:hypothetical protein
MHTCNAAVDSCTIFSHNYVFHKIYADWLHFLIQWRFNEIGAVRRLWITKDNKVVCVDKWLLLLNLNSHGVRSKEPCVLLQ